MNISDLKKSAQSYKVLIIDFDETIVQLHADWLGHIKFLRDKFPEAVVHFQDRINSNPNSYITVRNSVVEYFGDSVLPVIREITEKLEYDGIEKIVYNHEIIEFIKENCGRKEMFIWSGNCTKVITEILKDLKIYGCFSKLVTQDTLKYLKPDAEGFDQIFDPEKHKKSDYLFLGDSENDRKACESVGIDFYYIDFFKNISD